VWAGASAAQGLEPVNGDLIPEARAVLDYLEGVYGKQTLAGVSGTANAEAVRTITGRYPAILAVDISGWNSPTWGKSYRGVAQGYVDQAKAWWAAGGIVTMQFHWKNPLKPDGRAWVRPPKGTGPFDVGKAVTPGTEEHEAVMRDLRLTAEYLRQLLDARVPVLWRPLHEIDGGWFWWTDAEKPENTAALWRMMFDYYVKDRKLHNLIWVYSAALKCLQGKDVEKIDTRKRFYPGARCVDISGIDIYANSYYGWGDYRKDTYGRAFRIMEQVSGGKILALCESGAIPNPDMLAADGPPWLYCLPWFVGGKANSADWVRTCYTHRHLITRDELPALGRRNTPPCVRITSPADGAGVKGPAVRVRADARDRDGKVAKVQFRLLPSSWKNWFLRKREERAEALRESTLVGTAAEPPYSCSWRGVPAGLYNIIAVATDDKGAAGESNIVRVAAGMENLALGRAVRASSGEETASLATDGDLFTAWSSKKSDPQWVQVDLGSRRVVGGVVLLWTKAYARSYKVQLSTDANQWLDVHSCQRKRDRFGDSDVIRFAPATARYVRVHGTRRGTTWGGYSLYELQAYASIPEPKWPSSALVLTHISWTAPAPTGLVPVGR